MDFLKKSLTSSSTVAGPLDLSRNVPLPVPSCTPDPALPPDRWPIISEEEDQHEE